MAEGEPLILPVALLVCATGMVDLRENLEWIVGSAGAGVAVLVGWLLSSGTALNLVFLLLGAGITYFVQSRTQKKAWQREYSVKTAKTVFGPLYRDVTSMIAVLRRGDLGWARFGKWQEFQQDGTKFEVDEKFRGKLDSLLKRAEEYDGFLSENRSRVLPRLLREEAGEVFRMSARPRDVNVVFDARGDGEPFKFSKDESALVEHLIMKTDPRTELSKRYTELKIANITIMAGELDATGPDAETKFDELWKACLKRMEEGGENFNFQRRTEEILQEAEKIRQELARRIEKARKI